MKETKMMSLNSQYFSLQVWQESILMKNRMMWMPITRTIIQMKAFDITKQLNLVVHADFLWGGKMELEKQVDWRFSVSFMVF